MNRLTARWWPMALLLLVALAGCPRRPVPMEPVDQSVAPSGSTAPTSAPTAPETAAQTPTTTEPTGTTGSPTVSPRSVGDEASGKSVGPDWPRFLGPSGSGLAPSQGLKTSWSQAPPSQLWKVGMGDNGYAGPAVAGGRVYIVDHQGQEDVVRCLSLSDGSTVWTASYPEPGGDNYGFSRATPCIAGGRVYVVSRSGVVRCLNASDGSTVWNRNMQADLGGKPPQWNYAASPIVDDGKLILVPGGPKGTVAALNKDNGKTIWQGGGSDIAGYATPVPATIGGTKQYVVFNGKALTGVRASDGRLLWRVAWETSYDVNAATPIVSGNRIFITSGYGVGCGMVEVSGSSAQIVWRNKAIQAHFSSPVLYEGYIYGIGDPGNLVCLRPSDGKVLWQQGGFEKGGLIIVDGLILALQGGDGALVQVKATPAGYQEFGRFTPLGGQSWTAPVVAGGKLIVRNKTTLAAYALN